MGASLICCVNEEGECFEVRNVDRAVVTKCGPGLQTLSADCFAGCLQSPCEYLFQIDLTRRRDDKLGLDVDASMLDVLQIQSIRPGVMQEWNEQNPENRLEVGDLIMQVNRVQGSSALMLQELLEETSLCFTCLRPALLPEGALEDVLLDKQRHTTIHPAFGKFGAGSVRSIIH